MKPVGVAVKPVGVAVTPARVAETPAGGVTGDPQLVGGGGYHSSVPELKLEIQMLHDRVLVRLTPEEGDRRSSGGIVIPATAQMARRLAWGDVLGAGTNVRNVNVGDRVLFNPDDQLEVEVKGQTYLVIRERDLHAIASERTEHGTGLYL